MSQSVTSNDAKHLPCDSPALERVWEPISGQFLGICLFVLGEVPLVSAVDDDLREASS